jgi:hypothetical protein
MKRADYNMLTTQFEQTDWSFRDNAATIDEATKMWEDKIMEIINANVRKFKIKDGNSTPWLNGDIIHLSKKKKQKEERLRGLGHPWRNLIKITSLRHECNINWYPFVGNTLEIDTTFPLCGDIEVNPGPEAETNKLRCFSLLCRFCAFGRWQICEMQQDIIDRVQVTYHGFDRKMP